MLVKLIITVFVHWYFTICALQVISFSVLSIKSTIFGNMGVSVLITVLYIDIDNKFGANL